MLYFAKLIWDTIRLDTVALIPHSSHEPLHPSVMLEYATKRQHPGAEWRHLWLFVLNMLRAIRDRAKPIPKTPADEIFFVAMSKNQEHALHPIHRHLEEAHTPVASRLWTRTSLRRLWAWGFPLAIPFLPCVLWQYFASHGYAKRSFRWSMDQYWLNYGLYLACRIWLRRAKPRAVVVANDHSQISCVLTAAATAESIDTYYVQHACVTNAFPPLRTGYALLDGRDAVEKYDQSGASNTQAYTVGITKFDAYVESVRERDGLESVGVCFNKADQLDRCLELLNHFSAFSQELGFRVVVRPHPRMLGESLTTIEKLSHELDFVWSDPAKEPPFQFLCSQDVVLCGMSAIALEAALVNVVPINFVLSDNFSDWYGFAEQQLCRSTASFTELKKWLTEVKEGSAESIRTRAKHYSATVDTAWEGRSSELAAKIILWKSAAGEPVSVEKMSTKQLSAFEPLA